MKSARPKVLQTLAGASMIELVLLSLSHLDPLPQSTLVLVGHGAANVESSLAAMDPSIRVRLAPRCVVQEPQRGTGHALQVAAPHLADLAKVDGDLLVLLGDVPLVRPETLARLLDHHRSQRAVATMLTMHRDDPTGYGRVLRHAGSGLVEGVIEDRDATDEERRIREVNTGMFVFRVAPLLDTLPLLTPANDAGEFYLPDVLPHMRAQGQRIAALVAADASEVQGVNTRSQQAQADCIIRQRILEELMSDGVHIVDPSQTYIEVGVEIGADTVVHPFTVIRRGVKIGERCEVGPFAHVRAGTILADTAELGNFCEAKKAVLGPHTKAKHLTYLGDVTIGANTNVGAGTVICNYDGTTKHATAIGDNVFVGSGSMIIAPRSIGDRGRTGAGAVVTKDVAADQTVVGVPAKPLIPKAQKSIDAVSGETGG